MGFEKAELMDSKKICAACLEGRRFYKPDSMNSDDRIKTKRLAEFINPHPLKVGTLFECSTCGSHWYMEYEENYIDYIDDSWMPKILEWSSSHLVLTEQQEQLLEDIGSTPFREGYVKSRENDTPCTVRTKSGELFEFAIISKMVNAPYAQMIDYRLASEIEEISASQYALPLQIRTATAKAREISMGYAPTDVVLSNGHSLILNLTVNFLKLPGVDATKTSLFRHWTQYFDLKTLFEKPKIYSGEYDIVYFVADPAV